LKINKFLFNPSLGISKLGLNKKSMANHLGKKLGKYFLGGLVFLKNPTKLMLK